MQRQGGFIEGLKRLESLSKFVDEGPQAELLAEYYYLIEDLFNYFLQCLNVSGNAKEAHGVDESFPSDTEIITAILRQAAMDEPKQWLRHREDCCFCNHRGEVFRYLVRNIWKVLNGEEQYLLANIMLAYLRGDSFEQIAHIFKGLEALKDSEEPRPGSDSKFLKGILAVRELDDAGGVKNRWYGLVRRKGEFMGSTRCFMCPLGEESPVFRVDMDNDRKRFYFLLWDGVRVEGGLKFYLDPGKGLEFQEDSLDFAQTMEGVSLENESHKHKNWKAVFYGRFTSPREDALYETKLRYQYA